MEETESHSCTGSIVSSRPFLITDRPGQMIQVSLAYLQTAGEVPFSLGKARCTFMAGWTRFGYVRMSSDVVVRNLTALEFDFVLQTCKGR